MIIAVAIVVGMTFLWFVIWLVSDNVGDREPLLLDPVNAWTWTLILCIALDLAAAHARPSKKR
jgi:hypothetical protein